MKDMIDRCYEMFKENPGDFTGLMAVSLGKSLPIFAILGIEESLVHISKVFFILGFIKGICFSEQTAKLNDLVKE